MRTKLWFYLIVVCGAVESFTETLVNLGQNVTLQCEVSVKDVYWLLMKPPEPPVLILRSYSKKIHPPEYNNPTFNKTFSLRINSTLMIYNISANELGVYHCIQFNTNSSLTFSAGIRLHTQNIQNQSTEMKPEENGFGTNLTLSLAVNCALAVVVTVLTIFHCRRSGKLQAHAPDPQPSQDNSNLVYAAVQFAAVSRPVDMSDLNSTYASVKP